MVRIAGVDLPAGKKIEIALTYLYGIGRSLSIKVLKQAHVDLNIKVKDLAESDVVKLREVLKEYKIEGDGRKEVSLSVKRLMDTGTYRGVRHRRGLPVRGQRTKTNARTRRGKRKTVGSGRKKEEKT